MPTKRKHSPEATMWPSNKRRRAPKTYYRGDGDAVGYQPRQTRSRAAQPGADPLMALDQDGRPIEVIDAAPASLTTRYVDVSVKMVKGYAKVVVRYEETSTNANDQDEMIIDSIESDDFTQPEARLDALLIDPVSDASASSTDSSVRPDESYSPNSVDQGSIASWLSAPPEKHRKRVNWSMFRYNLLFGPGGTSSSSEQGELGVNSIPEELISPRQIVHHRSAGSPSPGHESDWSMRAQKGSTDASANSSAGTSPASLRFSDPPNSARIEVEFDIELDYGDDFALELAGIPKRAESTSVANNTDSSPTPALTPTPEQSRVPSFDIPEDWSQFYAWSTLHHTPESNNLSHLQALAYSPGQTESHRSSESYHSSQDLDYVPVRPPSNSSGGGGNGSSPDSAQSWSQYPDGDTDMSDDWDDEEYWSEEYRQLEEESMDALMDAASAAAEEEL